MTARPCPAPGCDDGVGNPILTGDPLCYRCTSRVDHALTELPTLYVHLHVELAPAASTGGEAVSGSRSTYAPLREPLLEHADHLTRTLIAWEAELRVAARLARQLENVRPAVALDRACALLRAHLSDGLAAPDGPAHAAAVLDGHRRARALLGWNTLVHRLTAPCPSCDVRALVRYDGDDYVVCSMCQEVWPRAHYIALVRSLLDATEQAEQR